MSEPIPESVPTSADPRSRRPVKRARTANNATATQANEIESLFLDPSRPITLPAAAGTGSKSSLAAPPEIVANVQGSSAGAGSGEFHVYKASRRREYERLRVMDEEAKKEEDTDKWEREERERRERDEERTRKNREKRNKKKNKGKKDAGKENARNGAVVEVAAGEKTDSVPVIQRRSSADGDQASDFGVAEVVKEIGITIHEDD